MYQRIITGGEEQILKIGLRTSSPQPLRIIVSDANQKNTVFASKPYVVNGDKFLYIRMPLAPTVALVQVFNEKTKDDTGFVMIGSNLKRGMGIERMPLEKKMDVVDMGNPDVRGFVDLAQRFCYNAGWIETAKYYSPGGKIQFAYLPTLMRDDDTGKESATPARVGEDTGIIEISQKLFIPFTVPMRFAILCHEFAHYYLNEEKYSETEADQQGLLLYLGLGYPHFEAYQAFLETFIGTPTDMNADRYNTIEKFINNFEQNKILMYA